MKTFVVSISGCTFIIRFNKDFELHILTCKDEPSINWTERLPFGTTKEIL